MTYNKYVIYIIQKGKYESWMEYEKPFYCISDGGCFKTNHNLFFLHNTTA